MTENSIGIEKIEEDLRTTTEQRDNYVKTANQNIAAMNGAIQALEGLLSYAKGKTGKKEAEETP